MKRHFDELDELGDEMRATKQRLAARCSAAMSCNYRQTCHQTPRLASARRAPLLQLERSMRTAVLQNGSKPARKILPASVLTLPDLRLSLVQRMMPWYDGAAAPKSCLSPVEMRTLIAAGDLLPGGKASSTTRITYYQPRLRFCLTEETNSERAQVQYTSYYNSFW